MKTWPVVLRGLRVEFRALCEHKELKSPDGRYIALATSTYEPRCRGAAQSHYEFVVEECEGRRMQDFLMPMPRDELINWRREGSISWANDSSCVTFEFRRTFLTLVIETP